MRQLFDARSAAVYVVKVSLVPSTVHDCGSVVVNGVSDDVCFSKGCDLTTVVACLRVFASLTRTGRLVFSTHFELLRDTFESMTQTVGQSGQKVMCSFRSNMGAIMITSRFVRRLISGKAQQLYRSNSWEFSKLGIF